MKQSFRLKILNLVSEWIPQILMRCYAPVIKCTLLMHCLNKVELPRREPRFSSRDLRCQGNLLRSRHSLRSHLSKIVNQLWMCLVIILVKKIKLVLIKEKSHLRPSRIRIITSVLFNNLKIRNLSAADNWVWRTTLGLPKTSEPCNINRSKMPQDLHRKGLSIKDVI